MPLGTLVLPGQTALTPVVTRTTGVPTSPLLAKIDKRRAEIAELGDTLIRLGQDRDLARQQRATAVTKVADAQAVQTAAQQRRPPRRPTRCVPPPPCRPERWGPTCRA